MCSVGEVTIGPGEYCDQTGIAGRVQNPGIPTRSAHTIDPVIQDIFYCKVAAEPIHWTQRHQMVKYVT